MSISTGRILISTAIMAITTYLIRMIPLALVRTKVKSVFIRSFLYYVPYAVLAAMTFPSILYATGSLASGIAGCAVAVILAYFNKSLLTVALCASGAALIVQLIGF